MPRDQDTEAPLVAEQNTGKPPTYCQVCCRYTLIFFVVMIIGFLIGIGLTKGMVAMIITLVVLALFVAGFIFFYGGRQCRQDCLGCFDMNQDGRLNCKDCALLFTHAPPEVLMLGGCALIIGVILGVFAI